MTSMLREALPLAVLTVLLALGLLLGLRVMRSQRQARLRAVAGELGLAWIAKEKELPMHKALSFGAAMLWLLSAVSAWLATRPPWVLPVPYRVLEALLAFGGLLVVVATGYLAVAWRANLVGPAWRHGAVAGLLLAPLTVAGSLILTWLLGGINVAPGVTPAGILGRALLVVALGGGALVLLMAPLTALGGWLAGRH